MTATTQPTKLDPGLIRLALTLVLGALAPLLDSTIVNVALPTLSHDLHTPVATVQWVATGYLLALTLAIPITGWAADRIGSKHLWLTAIGVFLLGSVASGLAWNITALIAFRILQGIGAGLMIPLLQTLLLRAAGGRNLGSLMAIVTLPTLAGPILGPVIGGVLAGHASWRAIFYVNVPICLAAAICAIRVLPADQPRTRPHLDTAGLLLLGPALVGIVYGLAQVGTTGGFTAPTVWLPAATGIALLIAFCRHARHAQGPLVDLDLFRDRQFSASTTLMFLSGFAIFGAMLLLPLYYQQVHGAGVVTAGLLLIPQGVGSLLARVMGRLTDRIGPRPIIIAGVLACVLGTVPFAFPGANGVLLAAALVVRGFGLSSANLAIMVGAYAGLTPAQIPHASSTTRIVQQLGGSFGTAVLAVLVQTQLTGHTAAVAFSHTFWWATGFAVLAFVPAIALRSRNFDRH